VRILYFSRDYTPHDHRFLSALAGTSHDVFYLRLEDKGLNLETRPLPEGIRAIEWWSGGRRFNWLDLARSIIFLRSLLDRLKPDLVHAGPVQNPAGLIAAAGFHPLVTMSWGSDLLVGARRGVGRAAARYTLSRSDAFVCDCQAVRESAEKLGMPSDQIVVFPWGVDLERFSPGESMRLRRELGWESDLVLLSSRAWEPQYGVDQVVEAFIAAAKVAPRLRLILLGNGSQGQRLRERIEAAGLQDKVHFGGQVRNDALPEYYRAADLYVSASHSDGSSVSLMEAMASGLPALVSDIPGNREWVTPGEHGWWFEDGEPKALAGCMQAACTRQADLATMGQLSHEKAVQKANWSENFQRLLEAYDLARAVEG
jgi:glycosyltransferase involved in cell wall biosynthesis